MRKMKLNADDLRVESFAAAEGSAWGGTVRGHDGPPPSRPQTCDNPTCETLICPCQVTQDVSNCVCPTP